MYDEMIRGLISELESYAEVAAGDGMVYCADLMRRAVRAIEKERPRARGNGHGEMAEAIS